MLAVKMVSSGIIETARKTALEAPPELLKKARRATGADITPTVRAGLKLVAASESYARFCRLRAKLRFTRTLAEANADR